MCGRFTRYQPIDVLGEYFGVPLAQEAASDPRFAPSLDCAPGSLQPVVCQNETGGRSLDLMRWGFSLSIQGRMKLVFNTKAEGVLESRLWKQRFSSTRCIVPATSFFEWPGKIKTEIALRNEAILGFAGLWGTLDQSAHTATGAGLQHLYYRAQPGDAANSQPPAGDS